ncbi:MAG: hypothetical protein Q7T62_02920 [Undibacterium sp.]|nr:hypothetical protein [Undibacterium sp.]
MEDDQRKSVLATVLGSIFEKCMKIRADPSFAALFSICFLVSACSPRTSTGKESEATLKLKEQFCSIAPDECNSKFAQKVYLAPPDAIYERMVRDQKLRIPFGYVSSTEMMNDPRYKKEELSVYLEAQMPALTPHSPQNLREFFRPYYLSSVGIEISTPGAEAISWEKRVEGVIQGARRSYRNPTQLPEKYGLKGWGENFKIWPRLAPCRQELRGAKPCISPLVLPPDNVLIPITPNGPLSVIICDPDELGDIDQEIMSFPIAERELLFSSNAGAGQRRSMCIHKLYYQKLDVWVRLKYPRRFLPQWRETEDRMRALLDSFIPTTTSLKK